MKILAVDLGDARTGLAACDRTEFLATPIGVIHERDMAKVLTQVAIAVTEYDIGMVIVGHPKNMNGTVGERAEHCEHFAKLLQQALSIPVLLWDERSTTVSAHMILNQNDRRGKKRKAVIDAVAATVILESFLAYRKNHPEEKEAQK